MNSPRILTPSSIEALDRGKLRDARTPGLRIEVLPSGKKVWKYARRVSRAPQMVRLSFGPFPARSVAEARQWAASLNRQVERGDDPRDAYQKDQMRIRMTVAEAHEIYTHAVREGRATRARRINKPRTIADKLEIYHREIAPKLANKPIHKVSERDLIDLVLQKGTTARVRANRLAAELKTFFGWASSLRGLEVGLERDPSRRLGDLRFPETPRKRKLSLQEIEWLLRAVVEEPRDFRRGMLLCLLTAARISEVIHARHDEVSDGVWTIPASRSKNSRLHRIALGPWSRVLMETSSEWVFPAVKVSGPRTTGWYKARDRVLSRMSEYAGRPIERFTPHDFRRTARSNTKRLAIDNETAEAMLNHLKRPLERIYDGYELEDEKAAWFRIWENEIVVLACKAGVAEKLEIPANQMRAATKGRIPQGWMRAAFGRRWA